jgi:hypothetical protein
MKNKKAELEPMVKIVLWIILFAVLSFAVYFLTKTLTT